MLFALVVIIRVHYKLVENLRFGNGLQHCGISSGNSNFVFALAVVREATGTSVQLQVELIACANEPTFGGVKEGAPLAKL
jgi:hypothetical protein